VLERGFHYGKYVPDGLPVRHPRTIARSIFYSALVIAYAIVACYNASDNVVVQHSLKVATSCFVVMPRPHRGDSHGPASTAIDSADLALTHLCRTADAPEEVARGQAAARKRAARQLQQQQEEAARERAAARQREAQLLQQQQEEAARERAAVWQREAQLLQRQRHDAASAKLHREYAARQTIMAWL